MAFEIRVTDKEFTDSPDTGPTCICSRCGNPILSGVPVRAWDDERPNHEYRFHPECLGMKVFDDSWLYQMPGQDDLFEILD